MSEGASDTQFQATFGTKGHGPASCDAGPCGKRAKGIEPSTFTLATSRDGVTKCCPRNGLRNPQSRPTAPVTAPTPPAVAVRIRGSRLRRTSGISRHKLSMKRWPCCPWRFERRFSSFSTPRLPSRKDQAEQASVVASPASCRTRVLEPAGATSPWHPIDSGPPRNTYWLRFPAPVGSVIRSRTSHPSMSAILANVSNFMFARRPFSMSDHADAPPGMPALPAASACPSPRPSRSDRIFSRSMRCPATT